MSLLKRAMRLRCKVGRRQLSVANVLCLAWTIVLFALIVARIRQELGGPSASNNSLTQRCRLKENMYSRECRYLLRSRVTLYPAPTPPLVTPTPSERQAVRRRYLADQCSAIGLQQQQQQQHSQQSSSRFFGKPYLGQPSSSVATVTSLYVDDSRRFIYCLVEGVAHLSWSRILLHETDRLRRYKTRVSHVSSQTANVWRTDGLGPLVPLDTNHFLQRQIDDRLDSYFKFMFVRHPFERLAAVYQDRLNRSRETIAKQTFRDKLARQQQQQQQQPSVEGQQMDAGSFNGSTNGSWTHSRRAITFQDLVTYMLDNRTDLFDGSTLNANLLPQHAVCQPCAIQYDYIGHYETLTDDAYDVLNTVGISKVRFPDPRRDGSRLVPTARIVSSMISGLRSDDQRQLREFYAHDFKLFGYI